MTSMTELLDAVTAAYSAVAELSLFLRVAWGVLILWAVAQMWSLRYVRVDAPMLVAETPKPARRPRVPRKKPAAETATASAADLMSSVGLSQASADTVYR